MVTTKQKSVIDMQIKKKESKYITKASKPLKRAREERIREKKLQEPPQNK